MKKIEKIINPYVFIVAILLILFSILELGTGHPIQLLMSPCGEYPFPQVQYGKIIAGIGALIISFFPYYEEQDTSTGFIRGVTAALVGIIIFIIGIAYALWGWSHYTC